MSTYAPASSMGWLDFDAAATERVSTLLRSLEEPSTLDVLGLGTVRDAFSDLLSPGTSTVQTRLRYFIFLPWIFQRLESEDVSAANFARKLREAEAQLIDCLRLGRGHGVIGRVAGRDLRRMPSDIYWGSMEAWGIRRLDMSISKYAQQAATPGRLRPERDDDGNAAEPAVSMWAAIPAAPEGFLSSEITFELEPDEAQVLTDGIRRRHPNTLVAVLSAMPGLSLDVDFPWELRTGSLPDRLVEVLHHARCFSEVTLGPRLVYNLLLARDARDELGWDTKELEEDQRDRIKSWIEMVKGRRAELSSWAADLPGFWAVLADYSISTRTQDFVNEVVRRVVADPDEFAASPESHTLIRHRELRLKSKRARLSHRTALENWNGLAAGGQLDYRWPVTKVYLLDIAAAGLED